MRESNKVLPYHIAHHVGQQGTYCSVGNWADGKKLDTRRDSRDLTSDTPVTPLKLLKCKKTMKIVTLNMRTSQHGKRIPELRALAQEQNIYILCLQEHRLCLEETSAEVDYIDVSNNLDICM